MTEDNFLAKYLFGYVLLNWVMENARIELKNHS